MLVRLILLSAKQLTRKSELGAYDGCNVVQVFFYIYIYTYVYAQMVHGHKLKAYREAMHLADDDLDDQQKARLTRSTSKACLYLSEFTTLCIYTFFQLSLPGEKAVSTLESEQKKRLGLMLRFQQGFPVPNIRHAVCSCVSCQYVVGRCGVEI